MDVLVVNSCNSQLVDAKMLWKLKELGLASDLLAAISDLAEKGEEIIDLWVFMDRGELEVYFNLVNGGVKAHCNEILHFNSKSKKEILDWISDKRHSFCMAELSNATSYYTKGMKVVSEVTQNMSLVEYPRHHDKASQERV
jgi:hypothetical protein